MVIKIPQSLDIISRKNISLQMTISITRPPPSLLKLPSGAIFNSLVISSSKNGVMKLDSVFGQLTAKTAHTLPPNSSLELQLVSLQPQLHLLLKKINGINVTVPFKKAVIQFLDELSPEAKDTQSVNTIYLQNGITIGHNTDIAGFELAIKYAKYDISNKKVFILGAGGVAPSIIYSLKKMKASKTEKYQNLNV